MKPGGTRGARLSVVALICSAVAIAAPAAAQDTRAERVPNQVDAAPPPDEMVDVFDLWRQLRHKPPSPPPPPTTSMKAFAPVIGTKPSSGLLLGVAGNVAFYRGDPLTTHISSAVASVTFSSKKQTSLTDRFAMFGRNDRWRLDADHRLQWTSLEAGDLGTSADSQDSVETHFDFVRMHHTAYVRVRDAVYIGAGLYFDNHFDVRPSEDAAASWDQSPYVRYSTAHDLPLESQISAGPSVDILWDTRDSFINAERGWLAKVSYRTLFDGFLGGDSTWQKINFDARTYIGLSRDRRHKLAFWGFADLVVGGVAPYFDLPATGLDTYGRSARGYREGQFRGEKLAYGEVEYRGSLMRNGLLGMVAFLNTTTLTNDDSGEQLFDSFATGGGAGLRLSINKRSKTNLCLDFGFGKQGSRGVYLAIQEAF
jgi:Omp85 superfamily domain